MINKLFVFANMGHLDQLPKSGGHTSARRVMNGFKDEGIEIVPNRRHRCVWEGKFLHIVELVLSTINDIAKLFFSLLFGRRKNSAFIHFSFAQSLVPLEFFVTLMAKFLGYKSLIYLQGGKIKDFLNNGSKLSLWLFRKNLDMQELVLFEGAIDVELCKPITQTPLMYFPSYVFDKDITCIKKSTDSIGICYFGKVAPDKNVHVVIETFEILAKKYSNLHLSVVGGLGSSKAYYEDIENKIKNSPFADRIERVGLSSFDFLLNMMKSHHIFLFPSAGRCEGHSNALNEAMSQGLIPIVSDWHFNRSIVGDDRFVVNGFDPKDYASKIDYLLENYNLQELSENITQYVKDNFACSVVNKKVVEAIKSI